MKSSRPWPWPRGASKTRYEVLDTYGLGLGLGLGGSGLDAITATLPKAIKYTDTIENQGLEALTGRPIQKAI